MKTRAIVAIPLPLTLVLLAAALASAATPPASVTWKRPTARMPAGEVLAGGLFAGRQLFADGAALRIVTSDGRLLRWSADQGVTEERTDLPVAVAGHAVLPRLLEVDGKLYAIEPSPKSKTDARLLRLEPGKLVEVIPSQSGLRGVTAAEGSWWWLRDDVWPTTDKDGKPIKAAGSSLWRAPLAGGQAEKVIGEIGPYDNIHVRPDDILLGWSGEEPRGIWRFERQSKKLALIADSRFFTREYLVVDGKTYVLLDNGNGWIHLLDEGRATAKALAFVCIAPGGSKHLQLSGKTIVWAAGEAILRLDLPGPAPSAVALDTRPADLLVAGGYVTWLDSWRGQLRRLELND
jgi:hypothetical protein